MSDSSQSITVEVPEEMTIYTAASLKERLLHALPDATHARFDLARVSDIDTAGIQLLLMCHNVLMMRGRTLSLANVGTGVRDALTLLGLHEAFTIATEQASSTADSGCTELAGNGVP